MSPPVDPAHPLSVFTTRELLANRAMARKRRRRAAEARALVARIDAELERRRQARGAFLHQGVPCIAALDETGGSVDGPTVTGT